MGRKNRSDEKRAEILEYVYETIKNEGIEGVTFSKIASYIGGNKSLLTYYFGTKEEMINALVEMCLCKYEQLFDDVISLVQDDEERLLSALRLFFGRQWNEHIDEKVMYSCFYLSLYNESIYKSFKSMQQSLIGKIEQGLEEFNEIGIIRIDDPHQEAMTIMGMIEGFDFLWITLGDGVEAKAQGERMQQIILNMLNYAPIS